MEQGVGVCVVIIEKPVTLTQPISSPRTEAHRSLAHFIHILLKIPVHFVAITQSHVHFFTFNALAKSFCRCGTSQSGHCFLRSIKAAHIAHAFKLLGLRHDLVVIPSFDFILVNVDCERSSFTHDRSRFRAYASITVAFQECGLFRPTHLFISKNPSTLCRDITRLPKLYVCVQAW